MHTGVACTGAAIGSHDPFAAETLPRLGLDRAFRPHARPDCRKVEAGHDNETAEMDFTLELGKLDAFRDAHAFIRRIENADGSIDTITYISRAGYALPDLAANQ